MCNCFFCCKQDICYCCSQEKTHLSTSQKTINLKINMEVNCSEDWQIPRLTPDRLNLFQYSPVVQHEPKKPHISTIRVEDDTKYTFCTNTNRNTKHQSMFVGQTTTHNLFAGHRAVCERMHQLSESILPFVETLVIIEDLTL